MDGNAHYGTHAAAAAKQTLCGTFSPLKQVLGDEQSVAVEVLSSYFSHCIAITENPGNNWIIELNNWIPVVPVETGFRLITG